METYLEIVLNFGDSEPLTLQFGPYKSNAQEVSEFKANIMTLNSNPSSIPTNFVINKQGVALDMTQPIKDAYIISRTETRVL